MSSFNQVIPYLPLLIPIVVVNLGLLIWALVDLFRPDRKVRGGNKVVWAIVIVVIETFGPIIYLLWGREDQ